MTEQEQDKLRLACVAIAGLGGVGGSYALTLARMGVGRFHLADFDVFEKANFNRQQGAFQSTLGWSKVEVIKKLICDINPDAEVEIYSDGITHQNIDGFLKNATVVMDGIDFYALPARRLLFQKAKDFGISVVTSGPLAFTSTLQVFTVESMSFEDYYDFKSCKTDEECLAAFMAGTAPDYLNRGQFLKDGISYDQKRAPSIATAIQMCAGIACTQAFLLISGRKLNCLAPNYLQFDPVNGRLATGKLRWGNRGAIQRIKRRIALKLLQGASR